MSPLGDRFPDHFKKNFSSDNVKVGAVLKTFSNHTKPPKEKRCIIVGIKGNSVGVVYINTENNAPSKLKSYQKPISKKGNESILEWDSFIDCANLYEEDLEDLKRKIEDNANAHLGDISTSDLSGIITLVKGSPKIDDKTLEKFGLK